MKHFESKEQIHAKKLEIDFEDGSWFAYSPAIALAWISTYISKAIKNK